MSKHNITVFLSDGKINLPDLKSQIQNHIKYDVDKTITIVKVGIQIFIKAIVKGITKINEDKNPLVVFHSLTI